MNNKDGKQESTDDLKAKLLKNLEETGYPLELQVGGILSKYGWRVDHNSYYIDEDEQKGREIDIIAITNTYSQEYKVTVWNNLICEVKKAKNIRGSFFQLKGASSNMKDGEDCTIQRDK